MVTVMLLMFRISDFEKLRPIFPPHLGCMQLSVSGAVSGGDTEAAWILSRRLMEA